MIHRCPKYIFPRGETGGLLATYIAMSPAAPLAVPYAEPATHDGASVLGPQDRYLAKHIEACAREHDGASVVSLFGPAPGTPRASMHAIIARQYCLFGCGLVYLPLLPVTIGEDTLEALLDSLVSWLRPQGELIYCAPTELPEVPERLLRLARNIDDASARVHCEHADKLAYLHLRRH